MRIEEGVKLDYADVLLKPKRSRLLSRSEVDLTRTFKFPHTDRTWTGVPIIASNMDTIGTFEVASILDRYNMLTCIHKHYSLEDWAYDGEITDWSNIIPSTGIREGDWQKVLNIYQSVSIHGDSGMRFVCLDVANGYSEMFVTHVEMMRKELPDVIIIAGNVATPEMVTELILHGADVVKVGIGPGSACTTRKVTGVGYPQLSAIAECADAAHAQNGHIIADGGCATPGDVAKAFCAGADFVMLGGMLAGHDETSIEFYGMSSETAMERYSGGVADYRASEGKHVKVPHRGPLEDTIQQILGGVRSACTYIGAESLKDAPKTATFIRVNNQYSTVFGT